MKLRAQKKDAEFGESSGRQSTHQGHQIPSPYINAHLLIYLPPECLLNT
jgi:hypothetical protein